MGMLTWVLAPLAIAIPLRAMQRSRRSRDLDLKSEVVFTAGHWKHMQQGSGTGRTRQVELCDPSGIRHGAGRTSMVEWTSPSSSLNS